MAAAGILLQVDATQANEEILERRYSSPKLQETASQRQYRLRNISHAASRLQQHMCSSHSARQMIVSTKRSQSAAVSTLNVASSAVVAPCVTQQEGKQDEDDFAEHQRRFAAA
ncbi:hypothetical protein V7S43_018979 [Phytophthora oleae]|uniref:Uncharacterized protein n=1 Tax=Phytophthora oleae TaxID=2107226 RepID=A0ABD3EP58_9STRA